MYEIKGINVPAKGLAIYQAGKKLLEVLEMGATVNDLVLQDHSLIDGYPSVEPHHIAWYKSALLFPFPNRLRDGHYEFEGTKYQFPINETGNHNALHGFVCYEHFHLEKGDVTEAHASIQASYDYDGRLTYYPFPFRMEVVYRLDQNSLSTEVRIMNRGINSLPMGFGWHPYFRSAGKIDQATLRFPAGEQMELDDRQLPTGNFHYANDFESGRLLSGVELDTGYRMNTSDWSVELADTAGQLTLVANGMPYLQIYTPPGRDSIALEPMSCGIDVFNSGEGLSVLSATESIEYRFSVHYQ